MSSRHESRRTSLSSKLCSLICIVVIVLAMYDIQFRERNIASGIQHYNNEVGSESKSKPSGLEGYVLNIDQQKVSTFRNEIGNSIRTIYEFWNISHYSRFINTFDIPPTTWEIQKNKFIRLILDSTSNKSFVVGFTGSSVTAGHDNYFHHAYPAVFQDTMQSIFSMMNITLVVS